MPNDNTYLVKKVWEIKAKLENPNTVPAWKGKNFFYNKHERGRSLGLVEMETVVHYDVFEDEQGFDDDDDVFKDEKYKLVTIKKGQALVVGSVSKDEVYIASDKPHTQIHFA